MTTIVPADDKDYNKFRNRDISPFKFLLKNFRENCKNYPLPTTYGNFCLLL